MSLNEFRVMYLDWVNNFLTISAFAEHYGISYQSANDLIELGQAVSKLKLQPED